MSKHTPGPWEIDHDTRPAEICCVHGLPPHGEQNQTFAYVRGALGYWDADENENLANIRLIAAAPDLLAALQEMVERFGSRTDNLFSQRSACDDARAAIVKATGAA